MNKISDEFYMLCGRRPTPRSLEKIIPEQLSMMEKLPVEILWLIFNQMMTYEREFIYDYFVRYPLSKTSIEDIGKLRLVSRRFHDVGIPFFGKALSARKVTLTQNDLYQFLNLVSLEEIAPYVECLNIDLEAPSRRIRDELLSVATTHEHNHFKSICNYAAESYGQLLAAHEQFIQDNGDIKILTRILDKLPNLKGVCTTTSDYDIFRRGWLGFSKGTGDLEESVKQVFLSHSSGYDSLESTVNTIILALATTRKNLPALVLMPTPCEMSIWAKSHSLFDIHMSPTLSTLKKLSLSLGGTPTDFRYLARILKCCSSLEVLDLCVLHCREDSNGVFEEFASKVFLKHLKVLTLETRVTDGEILVKLISNLASSLRHLTITPGILQPGAWSKFFHDPRIRNNLDLDTCLITDCLEVGDIGDHGVHTPLYTIDNFYFPSCCLYVGCRSGDYEIWTRYETSRRRKDILWLNQEQDSTAPVYGEDAFHNSLLTVFP